MLPFTELEGPSILFSLTCEVVLSSQSTTRKLTMTTCVFAVFLPTVSSSVVSVLREAFWKQLSNVVLDMEALPRTTVKLQVFSKLIQASEIEALSNLIDKLPTTLEKAGNHER